MSVNNLDVLNIAGYKFERLDDFEDLVPEFQSICVELELKGSVYLSPNGINFSIAGNEEAIHRCSVYNSAEAGEKLNAMLEMGSSRPWQEALATITGKEEMDATAILDYFAPLQKYLDEQNEGRQCGW